MLKKKKKKAKTNKNKKVSVEQNVKKSLTSEGRSIF